MPDPYLAGDTLDDVMRLAIEAILSRGDRVQPSKGWITEIRGVLLELSDPRARLSRTETRGKPFGCLGELCWYLAGTDALEFIAYYLPSYAAFADGKALYGAYGPRLFRWGTREVDQLANVTALLLRKPASRQAVIQLFDGGDIVEEHNDVPCTCTLQFMVRDKKLEMIAHMRSNDAFWGLPHDVFSFTMLQEILARSLSVDVGRYKHMVGSLHLYDHKVEPARQFLQEGWQSTTRMPPMPIGDPWPAIAGLRRAEAAIRGGAAPDKAEVEGLDPYWGDLVRLLEMFRCFKTDPVDTDRVHELRKQMVSDTYALFIEEKLKKG